MCIRDRNKRTKPEKIEIKKYDPVVRQHVIYKEAKIKSVSYTHLSYRFDLRQGVHFHSTAYFKPVSYTHLDVYKRQHPAPNACAAWSAKA